MDTLGEAFALFHKIAAHASGLIIQIANIKPVTDQVG